MKRIMGYFILGILLFGGVGFVNLKNDIRSNSITNPTNNNILSKADVQVNFNSLSQYFGENKGQLKDSSVLYYFHSSNFNIDFKVSEIQYTLFNYQNIEPQKNKFQITPLRHQLKENTTVSIYFDGAFTVSPEGLNQLPTKNNFYIGNNKQDWVENAKSVSMIRYQELYKGIDLQYYFSPHGIKYDFIAKPGSDPSIIAMKYSGINSLSVSRNNLLITSNGFKFSDSDLSVYQSHSRMVDSSFKLHSDTVRFRIGEYDRTQNLVIDPLVFAAYYDGGADYDVFDISTDSNGDIIGTGTDGFMADNAIVFKISANGSILLFQTNFGGGGTDYISSAYQKAENLGIDKNNNIYVTATTSSTNFPTMSAYNSSSNGGFDIFLTKINPSGSLIYSTYLGGSSDDIGFGLFVDSYNHVHITGMTSSSNFPITARTYNSTYGGSNDAFIMDFDMNTNSISYSTFFGGSNFDYGLDIKVDNSNNTYVVGQTASMNIPTTNNANQSSYGGGYDVFIAKLSNTGTQLMYSSYFGGSNSEISFTLKLDELNNVYIFGTTYSSDFPVSANAMDKLFNGSSDVFVAKFDMTNAEPLFSTFLGGNGDELGYAMDVNRNGIYVIDQTSSNDYPLTNDAYNSTKDSIAAGFTKVSLNGSKILYSTYFGGDGNEIPKAITISNTWNVIFVCKTDSTNIPITSGTFSYPSTGTNILANFMIDQPETQKPIVDSPVDLYFRMGDTPTDIIWTAGDEHPAIYKIFRDGSEIQSGSWDNATSLSLTPDTSSVGVFNYTIEILDTFGNKITDMVIVEIDIPVNTPSVPPNLLGTQNFTHVLLNWSTPVSDGNSAILGYLVYRSINDTLNFVMIANITSSEYVDGSVVDGSTYYYKVSAYNAVGEGNKTQPLMISFIIPFPSAPQNLSGLSNSTGIYLIWEAPTLTQGPKIMGYRVYKSTEGTTYQLFDEVTSLLDVDTSVKAPGTYYYYVVAFSSKGESEKSNIISLSIEVSQTSETSTPSSMSISSNSSNPGGTGNNTAQILIGTLALLLISGTACVLVIKKRRGKKP